MCSTATGNVSVVSKEELYMSMPYKQLYNKQLMLRGTDNTIAVWLTNTYPPRHFHSLRSPQNMLSIN